MDLGATICTPKRPACGICPWLTPCRARAAGLLAAGGYSVTLLLRFERTGRYLKEKVLEGLEVNWANTVRPHPGTLELVVGADTRGGYRDDSAKEIVLTEDLQHDQQIDSVRILNPFLVGPEILDAPAP